MRIWRLIGASFKRDLVVEAMKNDRDLALFFKILRNLNVESEPIDWC